MGGSASAARQVDRARRGKSNIGLKVRKTAVQRRSAAAAAPVSAGVAGASRKLRRTLYGNRGAGRSKFRSNY
ncbi:TPA: hypothetical protein HA278_02150 [Candidatus Woesearchaeota archaeon]|nr:hypothetical protein [Candidatus Woesearchaeota archaeon]